MAIQQSPLRELALFAGAGGGILGGHFLGWKTICAVERDAYAASVLVARQNDKILPVFPIWSDVTTFDGRPWRGCVDVISGGFPCQDISAAGKGAGIDGKRSGLWGEFARIIGEVRPRYVFVENSPMLTSRGLGRVLGDLASMGYDARWCVLGADDVGAPHQRKRIWILAENTRWSDIFPHAEHDRIGWRQQLPESAEKEIGSADTKRQLAHSNLLGHLYKQSEIKPTEAEFDALGDVVASCDDLGNPDHNGCFATEIRNIAIEGSDNHATGANKTRQLARPGEQYGQVAYTKSPRQPSCILGQGQMQPRGSSCRSIRWWEVEPRLDRVANGVAHRVDRLRAIGNGQVSSCMATAFSILQKGFLKYGK